MASGPELPVLSYARPVTKTAPIRRLCVRLVVGALAMYMLGVLWGPGEITRYSNGAVGQDFGCFRFDYYYLGTSSEWHTYAVPLAETIAATLAVLLVGFFLIWWLPGVLFPAVIDAGDEGGDGKGPGDGSANGAGS